jgi:hypothetical protein
MDRLYRLRKYATQRHVVWQLAISIGVFGAWCVANRNALATPITLAFDAIVGQLPQGADALVPPRLNVSLKPGDLVTGAFTFEPVDAPSNAFETTVVEPFQFVVNVKSQSLVSSQFGIDASNDVRSSDEDPYDSIILGCTFGGNGTVCAPRAISLIDPTLWTSTISLYGATSVLDGPDIPTNPHTWALLLPGGLDATFFDPATTRYYGFTAAVQSFRAVPEPATITLVLIAGLVLSGLSSYR